MIAATVLFGLIGFIDDYIKVFKKNKEGLAGRFKIVGQVAVGALIGSVLYFHPDVQVHENVSEDYVHRIGRCGRAGEEGVSISLCDAEELAYIRDIEKLTKQKISEVSDHPFPQTDKPMNNAEKKEFENIVDRIFPHYHDIKTNI